MYKLKNELKKNITPLNSVARCLPLTIFLYIAVSNNSGVFLIGSNYEMVSA
jgi:hypothetical protein